MFVSKYRPRYYKIGLKEFGCGTSDIITGIAVTSVTPKVSTPAPTAKF